MPFASNPLTKFPMASTPPGTASTASPNRNPGTGGQMPTLKYSAVGASTHAPHTVLTPVTGAKLGPGFGQQTVNKPLFGR